MPKYKSYTHIERLNAQDCEGILEGHCVVQPKVDGTNCSVWYDDTDGGIHCGSRKREINPDKDNAGFAHWMTLLEEPEPIKIRTFLYCFPHLTIYGEWTGTTKFIGQIKDYNEDAKATMFIFDVFDNNTEQYLPDDVWRPLLVQYGLEEYLVPVLAEFDNPTEEQLIEVAKNNKFLLDNANHPGEGIVIKNYDFINKYGRFAMGKIVLDEYKQMKKQSNKVMMAPGELERAIVDTYVTDAELGKTKAKIVVACNAEEFDVKNPKHVGMYVNTVFNDLLVETPNWCKKFKTPVVDFSKLKGICQTKARKYIGL